VATFGAPYAQSRVVLAGIDHIPLAVRDLEAASETFKRLGFSIKPGRAHAAGIRNRHIKFPDGSGLELIAVGSASDELSAAYLKHLKAGDGPAYLSFHVRDAAKLASVLVDARIAFDQAAGLTTFKDPSLSFVFITPDNRSPTDRPEHFAHANRAFAMSEVWIASEESAPLKTLLLALGAKSKVGTVQVPESTEGEAFELQNGRVIVVPGRYQLREGRPVIGVVMSTMLDPRESPTHERPHVSTSRSASLIEPNDAHGFWLEFRVER
jgi:catechol 2,3-dioxygenase-like lactoylglutathione lyase family enzyme